jgi:hypothetical protein
MIVDAGSRMGAGPARLLRQDRGQIALMFVALMGLVIILTPPLMNLGEVARLKTKTAVAADAGALTGASYASSAANFGAHRAQLAVQVFWSVQLYFGFPFCLLASFLVIPWLLVLNTLINLIVTHANEGMIGLFQHGMNRAFAAAMRNSPVDDRLGEVQLEFNDIIEQTKLTTPPTWVDAICPFPCRFEWERQGLVNEPSWLDISVVYPPINLAPQIVRGGFPLLFFVWVPFCFLWCFPAWGWNAGGVGLAGQAALVAQLAALSSRDWNTGVKFTVAGGLVMMQLRQAFNLMRGMFARGPCGYMTMFPIPVPTGLNPPNAISNSVGRVRVTVTMHREPGAQMAFWTMRYPDVTSIGEAEYAGAHVRRLPFTAGDRSEAQLVVVQ